MIEQPKWTQGPYRAENLLTPEDNGKTDICARSPTESGKLRVVAENVRIEDAPLLVAAPAMYAALVEALAMTCPYATGPCECRASAVHAKWRSILTPLIEA
jgi:hypothetical protein